MPDVKSQDGGYSVFSLKKDDTNAKAGCVLLWTPKRSTMINEASSESMTAKE